jgi:signal transduction histidine kinase
MKPLSARYFVRSLPRVILACALFCISAPAKTDSEAQKRTLILYALGKDAPATSVPEGVYQKTLSDGLAGRLDYYAEYIDVARFPEPEYQAALRDFLHHKYTKQRFDLIIAAGNAAFEFVKRYRAELFPGAPVVFNGPGDLRSIPNSTGLVFPIDMKSTLDLALRLQPEVKQVFVVSGASEFDKYYENIARRQFQEYESRLAFTYLTGLPLRELQRAVARLPEDSVIYYLTMAEDGAGNKFIPLSVLDKLSPAANAPIYCPIELVMDHGIVGGSLFSVEIVAQQTAGLALRVLQGENPDRIPVTEIRPYINIFDWRQLRRWRIGEDRLPPGSVVRFREPSFWILYKWRIIGVASLCVAEALLIFALLVQRARRGRIEQALRESEESLRNSYARIEDLAGRLIAAQEEERRYVARELHDDLNQQVAAMAIGISRLKRQLPDADGAVQGQIAKLQDNTDSLSERIRQMSHELHSSVLQHAGLPAALNSYCAEFSDLEGIAVTLDIRAGVEAVPSDAALCLYRVAQESLRNIARHSGARSAVVTLTGVNGAVELRVVDQGVGFDPGQARGGHGLGLVSMEERVKLLHGSFVLTTRPGAGTELRAQIPLRG